KGDVEQIRGVNSDYSIQKLLEKELIEIKGKSEGIGRPLLYGTSQKFMEYFGINSIQELPQPKDFSQPENQIGEERD
ncbi:MAG: SMC-Scp complex subunit ScpB, partial [Cytophagales bacterium]